MSSQIVPDDCQLCPRLAAFRQDNRAKYPDFHNNPVPSFGPVDAEFLVVGLAPGLKGANQTAIPFTGDYAGLILYESLLQMGFAQGHYNPETFGKNFVYTHNERGKQALDYSLKLVNCRITNAVRCVPPENKPETDEIKECNQFLIKELAAMKNLKAIMTLGLISHNAILRALRYKQSHAKFGHGNVHNLSFKEVRQAGRPGLEHASCVLQEQNTEAIRIFNSYHCSRYNINTGRLTRSMFDDVLKNIKSYITG